MPISSHDSGVYCHMEVRIAVRDGYGRRNASTLSIKWARFTCPSTNTANVRHGHVTHAYRLYSDIILTGSNDIGEVRKVVNSNQWLEWDQKKKV